MQTPYESAMNKALFALGRSSKSEKQLKEYLIKKEFDTQTIEQVVLRLKDLGYINDELYAQNIARIANSAGHGKRKLMQKLSLKGIPSDISKEVVENIDQDAELSNAVNWARKLRPKINKEGRAQDDALMRRLASKGFDFSVIRSAISIAKELDEEEEE